MINLIMYIATRNKPTKTKFHKSIALVNIIFELIIVAVGLYKINPLFSIFSPFAIGFTAMLGYGITEELSDEEKAALVVKKGIRLPEPVYVGFIEFMYFPGSYFIKSWVK